MHGELLLAKGIADQGAEALSQVVQNFHILLHREVGTWIWAKQPCGHIMSKDATTSCILGNYISVLRGLYSEGGAGK